MFTAVGVLLVLLFLASLMWGIIKQSADETDAKNEVYNARMIEEGQDRRYFKSIKDFPKFPIGIKKRYIAIVAILVFALNGLFFWAEPGTAYAVQYPWGGDKMVTTQGLKVKAWGKTIALSYETSIKDIIIRYDDQGNQLNELPKNETGAYNRRAQRWEFSDAIKADIAVAVIIGVSIDDPEKFLKMADRNRTEGKLISGRILPNIDATLKNTCKLMDAQEYISGKASDFDRYFKDQLENGMYLVEEYTPVTIIPEIVGSTKTKRTVGVSTNEQKRYKIKRDAQGNIMRDETSNTLKQYGLTIYQAKVTSIDWEDSFDTRLDLQKDEVAKTQLEKQEAERQFYTTKKEIAKGEAEKAAERARLEKEQIKLTIAAETEAKVAAQNLIAEKKIYEVEKYKALSKKVAADATYYENNRRVQAGLTPQERLKGDVQMNKDKWSNIARMRFDGVYMNGTQSGKSDGLLSSLLGAEVAKSMVRTRNK